MTTNEPCRDCGATENAGVDPMFGGLVLCWHCGAKRRGYDPRPNLELVKETPVTDNTPEQERWLHETDVDLATDAHDAYASWMAMLRPYMADAPHRTVTDAYALMPADQETRARQLEAIACPDGLIMLGGPNRP